MSYSNNKEQAAKEKMLQAERALADYFRSFTYDPELEKKLTEAVKAARDEYVNQLSSLWPERFKSHSA